MEHFENMFNRHPYVCMMMVGSIGTALTGVVKALKTKTVIETTTHKLDEDDMAQLVEMIQSFLENKVNG